MFLLNHARDRVRVRWPRREIVRARKVGVRRRSGLTIIEMVVASLLLGLVLMGAYAMVTQATLMMRQARNHYVASTLCLARLERARDFEYSLLRLIEEHAPGVVVDQNGNPTRRVPTAGARRWFRTIPFPGSRWCAFRHRFAIREPASSKGRVRRWPPFSRPI